MLHEDRERAGSFGADAERYDRARPRYPSALVDDLLEAGARDLVDVGCGTGIASRLFADRGVRVLGVEPDARMAAVARRHGIEVDVAAFETWDAAGRQFDLLTSAQAWHWVDPVAGAERAAAVLRSGGGIGLIWNQGILDPVTRHSVDDVYRQHAPGLDEHSILLGNFDEVRFTQTTRSLDDHPSFTAVRTRTYHWEHRYTRDEWLDQLPTHSDHASLPPARLAALLTGVGGAIDALGGQLTMTYATRLITARRR